MTTSFIRDRITQLRIQKGVSEYQMSYDLGHSRGYINNISSGKTLPSMSEFLSICDYFSITPSDFFNENISHPTLFNSVLSEMKCLKEEDLILVHQLVKRLNNKDA